MNAKSNLDNFVISKELADLEDLLAEFNIFEAVGAVRSELRHSDFLAFMLSPNERHGVGENFLKFLLKEALLTSGSTTSTAEIDVEDMHNTDVQREWTGEWDNKVRKIDILLLNPHFAIAIENKINISESEDQLSSYSQILRREYGHNGRKIIMIYLTPEGEEPSQNEWISLSYKQVVKVMRLVAERLRSKISLEIITLIKHYATMLERHIVEDSKVKKLCQDIYKTHRHALELIFEHKPDRQMEIKEQLEQLIKNTNHVDRAVSEKRRIRFKAIKWGNYSIQKTGNAWNNSNDLCLFEFENERDRLDLRLTLGSSVDDEARENLYNAIPQWPGKRPLTPVWTQIYKKKLFKSEDLDNLERDELQRKIEEKCSKALNKDIPEIIDKLEEAMKQIDTERRN